MVPDGTSLARACNPSDACGNYLKSTYITKNSNRLWTRAEVKGSAHNGPPQTLSGSKSVMLRWGERDKSQCTHVACKNNFSKCAHAVGKRSQNFLTGTCTQATIRRQRDVVTRFVLSDVWLLIARSVGMKSVTDALKWSNCYSN